MSVVEALCRFYYCLGGFCDSDVNRLLDQTSDDVASKINSPIRYDDSRDLFNNGTRTALSLSLSVNFMLYTFKYVLDVPPTQC